MKVLEENRPKNLQSENFDKALFGIKDENLPVLFDILRNRMYSNKVQAVIREYWTNATDANVENGFSDTPVEIGLPSIYDLNFSVRDFGKGLSAEEIKDIYVMYGSSTKRNTNKQIGQLGLGSKAAFCYTDSFIITSYQNGKATTYNAFIDPTEVGAIVKLNEQSTKEKDGIKIIIPVKAQDVSAFLKEAEYLFKYARIFPKINGQTVKQTIQKYIFSGGGWGVTESHNSIAIMGDIGYPIDVYALDNNSKLAQGVKQLLSLGVNINFDIGELDIASTREALQYSKSTIDNINKKCEKIIKELEVIVNKEFSKATNIIEAKQISYSIAYGKLSKLKNIVQINRNFKWNNINLYGAYGGMIYTVNVDNSYGEMYNVTFDSYKNKTVHHKISAFNCDDNSIFHFYEDDVNGEKWIIRCGEILKSINNNNQHNYLYVFKFKDSKAKDEFIKNEHFENVNIKKLSSITPPKVTRVKNGKNQQQIWRFDSTKTSWAYNSERWIGSKLDKKAGGIYLPIYNFYPYINRKMKSVTDIQNLFPILDQFKIKTDDIKNWVGIKVKDSQNLDPKLWKQLDLLVIDRIVDVLIKNKPELLIQNISNTTSEKNMVEVFDIQINNIIKIKDVKGLLDNNSIFIKYLSKLDEVLNENKTINSYQSLIEILKLLGFDKNTYKLPTNLIQTAQTNTNPTTIKDVRKEVYKTYPILQFLDKYSINNQAGKLSIIEYIKILDKT